MKIVYFSRYDPANWGVHQKIISQVNNLRKKGIDAQLIYFGFHKEFIRNLNFVDYYLLKSENKIKIFQKIKVQFQIFQILLEQSKKIKLNDILYIRFLGPDPFFLSFLLKKRKFLIVTEHQSIEPLEIKYTSNNYLYLLSDFFLGRLIRKKVDGIIGVTDEITQYELNRSGNSHRPHLTIGNGFDVNSVPIRSPDPFNNIELHLLCVANVSKWHGIDRLIRGISQYKGSVKVQLHIAGDGGEISSLKKLVNMLQIQNLIIFHGFLSGMDLENLFNKCHIAVGSLGIHRKGLIQTSELKVREYCARGIPFITACDDTDFPNTFQYLYKFPANDSPIDIDKIIIFAQTIYQDSNLSLNIREFALNHLDWSIKMEMAVSFFKGLHSGSVGKG